MMLLKKFFAALLALAMSLTLSAALAEDNSLQAILDKGTFIIGLDDSFPPMGYRDENNDIVGFDIDVARAVAEKLGVEFIAQPISWEAKELELSSGNIDCIWNGMSITPEREESMAMTFPYLNNQIVCYTKDDASIASLADLAGKSVAVQLGTSGESLLSEGGDLESLAKTFGSLMTCDSFLKCFTELGGGAVDAVIVDKPVATSYVQQNAGFTILDEELGAEQYGIAFRSGDQELCDTVQAAVQKLVDNGTYAKIAEKYPDIVNNLLFLSK